MQCSGSRNTVSREEADEVIASAEVPAEQYVAWLGWGDERLESSKRRSRLTTACSGRRCAPPLMLNVGRTDDAG